MSLKHEGNNEEFDFDPEQFVEDFLIDMQGLENAYGPAGAARIMAEHAKRQARSVLGPRSVNKRFKQLSRILEQEAQELRDDGEADYGEPGNS